MQIFVKLPNDKTITLEVEVTDSIDKVKLELEKKTTIPIDQQMLKYGNKYATSGSLFDNGIGKEAYIHLNMRLRGD